METIIKPNLRKPFRGLTTIQLFDKETGNLLEEYHDENTYNDRLQYLSYLDSILHCKSPKVSNHMTHFNRVDLLEDERSNHLINICNAKHISHTVFIFK